MKTTYRKAGVNIDAGNELVKRIKKFVPKIGGFSGLYPLKGTGLLLASSTDGVGTKLKLAFILNKHDTIGIDLVAMNVNDLVCSGAKPIFFLDYFACGKLNVGQAEMVVKGIYKGCVEAGCALLGGETAEMPGFYKRGEYDLAGFSVGVVEKGHEITGKKIKAGDILIGVPSSGPHSNGYSLIRKVFKTSELKKYKKELLAPTRIYVKDVLKLLGFANKKNETIISAISHITGGGFFDNIERLLPGNGLSADVDKNAWNVPGIFNIIKKKGNISDKEMYRTFNMGIGLVVIVRKKWAKKVKGFLKGSKEIGEIKKGRKGVSLI